MKFTTIQNRPVVISYNELLNDRGWVLAGNTATHLSCNSNTKLKLIGQPLEVGEEYSIVFTIVSISGTLGVGFDTATTIYTTTGLKTLVMTPTSVTQKITLWGTGDIVISKISVKKAAEVATSKDEHTIAWGEDRNGWITFKAYRPEMGFSMFNDLFTYKNGILQMHDQQSASYNVFYGDSFDTFIEFPMSSPKIKTYKSIAIHSNRIVGTSEDGVKTSLGHVSDLMEIDFTEKEGVFYANFLRNKLENILTGSRLKGRYIVIELQAKGQEKLQIFKIVAKSDISTVNE